MAKKKKASKSLIASVEKKHSVSKEKEKINFTVSLILKILPILLVIFAMWYAYDVRTQSVDLDSLEARVESNIMNQIQQLILQDIEFQYPNVVNQDFLQEEAMKRYQDVLNTGVLEVQGQTLIIDDLIAQQSSQAKKLFQDDSGNTYLTAIDPYFFMRKAQNLATTGSQGDEIIDGIGYDTKQLAPQKKEASDFVGFHTWLEAKLIGSGSGSFSENSAKVFILPAILSSLVVIPVFLFTRVFTNNLVAGMVALILVSIGTFVSRTTAGFVDTDAYNVLFPLAIAASILYGFVKKERIITVSFSILAGFFTGFFLWAWGAGSFFVVFILFSLIIYIVYLFTQKILFDKNVALENSLITFFSYFVSSFIFVFLLAKRNLFEQLLNMISNVSSSSIGNIATSSIWPNVYSSVAELNPASFVQIISAVGGEFIFLLACIGLVFLSLDFKSEDSQIKKASLLVSIVSIIWFVGIVSGGWFIQFAANSKLIFLILLFLPVGIALLVSFFAKNTSYRIFIVMLLSIWMAGTIYMSLNGVRFILLLAPAFAIAAGTGLYYIANFINNYVSKEFTIKGTFGKLVPGYVVISIIFFMIFSPMYTQAYAIGNNAMPNFDDAWYEAMYKIDNQTNPNTIITSWWDFGHFFAAVGNRGVTFDGGSQTTPQAHWVGKLLLEGDEEVSVDILRMLTCGGNKAFNTAFEISKDPTGGVHINEMLYDTFGKSIDEKREVISSYKYYSFTQTDVDLIMDYLHCVEPRENLVITSGDMVGKTGVWAHWGSWDFTKKYVHDNYKEGSVGEIASVLDKDEELIETYVNELRAIDLNSKTQNVNREQLINQWFAPYPTYGESVPCTLENTTLICGGGLGIDILTGEVTNADQFGISIHNIVLPVPNNLRVIQNDENGLVDLLVTQSQSGFQIMIMQAPLGTSLFTKLYFLNGIGTTKFEEFHTTQTQTADRVSIWKTNFGESVDESLLVNSVEYTISSDELKATLTSENISLE